MIIHKLNMGRFGNQLFQIAATLSHASDISTGTQYKETAACFPSWSYNKHLAYPIYDKLDMTYDCIFNNKQHDFYKEPGFHFSPLPMNRNLILEGFFQSEKYFQHNESLIKRHFSLKAWCSDVVNESYFNINAEYPKHLLVAIHVRRADYLDKPDFHPVLTMDYYNAAMERMESYFGNNILYIVFSDDPAWCHKHFNGSKFHVQVCGHEVYDMHLMAKCDCHIIANSSYSWWGAWLHRLYNKENDFHVVIAPKTWFGPKVNHDTKDLYCEKWMVI